MVVVCGPSGQRLDGVFLWLTPCSSTARFCCHMHNLRVNKVVQNALTLCVCVHVLYASVCECAFVCVCVCGSVCMRERDRRTDRQIKYTSIQVTGKKQ